LGKNRSESSLELLNSVTELKEIIIELALFNIHNVIADVHEFFNSFVELLENLHDWSGKLFSLSVTDFNLLKLVELNNGASEVHDILASFLERIKSHKKSIGCDFPLVASFCLSFILKVGILKLGASL
jgi:hypothetical protein